ncbi:type II toxin-antitoxin system VapC family toxin [Cyanobium sp. ATX 6F1]|uniref:type II toxin-antitoxin system VapC family toxin n=1 Tax=unclassified Cyanobium TaxID=2627006 RepID=UPI0020CEC5D6|nr:type II toxin-antitoxin system VapC family toxin [Cyanobium sp. ATX 6F1]MCP9917766.1 type II toxin-antitoxin system VapC family toxin [Cyanobium sp. ATX 6F1]
MILFCDTSALIKLLISEPGSDQMLQASMEAEAIAVCRITWAEVMAGMARRQREVPGDAVMLEQAREQLIQSWPLCTIVEVSQSLVETAGRFADVFALRGYDSVQLAAAHELQINSEQPLTFACFDRRLKQAAALLKMDVLS